ncbi:MAG: hypothetical protein HQL87_03225 [Magnetococcales bacterium]|nr:hypothetical protein [Magnetococcales bacterium]
MADSQEEASWSDPRIQQWWSSPPTPISEEYFFGFNYGAEKGDLRSKLHSLRGELARTESSIGSVATPRDFEMLPFMRQERERIISEIERIEKAFPYLEAFTSPTPVPPDQPASATPSPIEPTPAPIPPDHPPSPAEDSTQRRERLLEWAKEEFSSEGKKGTIQRVADREGITRQVLTKIMKRFPAGQEFLNKLTRS